MALSLWLIAEKDMILSGGFNVFPRNIEEAIYEHQRSLEVTVIGIPDAYRGQSAKAFIALKIRTHGVWNRRTEGVPCRQARQIRDADRNGNTHEPTENTSREVVEEGVARRGDCEATSSQRAARKSSRSRVIGLIARGRQAGYQVVGCEPNGQFFSRFVCGMILQHNWLK